jgi:hypothetical protein
MGFDQVDRQFRPPQPIKLECQWCRSTDDTVKARPHPAYETDFVLCDACAGRSTQRAPSRY